MKSFFLALIFMPLPIFANPLPLLCSERFVETYTQNAELIVVEGENHMITRRLKTVVSHAVSFFASQLQPI